MDGDHRVQWGKDWRTATYDGETTQVNLPCRKCVGCGESIARDWSVRCFHEALLHTEKWFDAVARITTSVPKSCIVTLTYNDEHLLHDRCLDHSVIQRFLKRIRIRRSRAHARAKRPGKPPPLRYFGCGEYGGKTFRPHYHFIIYGESFDDRYHLTDRGKDLAGSFTLDELWSQCPCQEEPCRKLAPTNIGRATVDSFTFAGASYVAGYVAKKSVTEGIHLGPIKETVSNGTTRFIPIAPEYRRMSTHPGLGAKWILKPENLAQVYSEDSVRIGPWRFHPPKYYDTLLQKEAPRLVGDIIANRLDGQSQTAQIWSQERCSAAEKIKLADLQLRRDSL